MTKKPGITLTFGVDVFSPTAQPEISALSDFTSQNLLVNDSSTKPSRLNNNILFGTACALRADRIFYCNGPGAL